MNTDRHPEGHDERGSALLRAGVVGGRRLEAGEVAFLIQSAFRGDLVEACTELGLELPSDTHQDRPQQGQVRFWLEATSEVGKNKTHAQRGAGEPGARSDVDNI
jgi:hypothetical protein